MDRQMRLDFQAAEKAYRTNMAEIDRLYQKGGTMTPTRLLKATSTGTYLASTGRILKQVKSRKLRTTGSAKITGVLQGAYSATELLLTGCEDNSAVRVLNSAGEDVTQKGAANNVRKLVVTRVEGAWLLPSFETQRVPTFQNTACTSR